MTIHYLKCWPPFCGQIARGEKRVEIRRDDRGFEPGDMLHLEEWVPPVTSALAGADSRYTGRHVAVTVTHLLRAEDCPGGLQPGYVAMSVKPYRTWIEGQDGPGDWTSDAAPPVRTEIPW